MNPQQKHIIENLIVGFALLFWASLGTGAVIPEPETLHKMIGEAPVPITVLEPHLADVNISPAVTYRGYPIRKVFQSIFGNSWRNASSIEFRALDGYVSRIPIARFQQYQALLAFEKADGGKFEVPNLAQHKSTVSLGPYYLAWNNVRQPNLIKDGATYWPYQAVEISLINGQVTGSSDQQSLEKYCLSCHKFNNIGGDKAMRDLAQSARTMGEETFLTWVLNPEVIAPDTAMPPLPRTLPEEKRRAIALRLFGILNQGAPADHQ